MTHELPKAELHCHIEGAASPGLVVEQAAHYGTDVSAFIDGDRFVWHDFTSFLAAYDTASSLFRTEEDYARLAESYLASIAAQGAIYSEIFVSPDHAADAGLSPLAYVAGLGEGIARARAKHAIECRMIVIGVRHLGAEAVERAARFAASGPHPLVTGFGMAGDERIGRLDAFADAFSLARQAGLGITVHAGELAGAESVRDALDHIAPSRIGHGVRAVEDFALVERLAETTTVLEVCPGSNVALGIAADFASHPLAELVAAGVPVTLNSDDPPYFDTSLGHEYAMAAQAMGFDDAALRRMTRTAIEAAFVDEQTRGELLAKVDSQSTIPCSRPEEGI
ncbi:adenosine deaminase [Pararhizobium mangrovi]|uniref:Adenine deaminase n=1 Tax=Pararhizobium mangrovi TaxID=2590452 RepID=A0A506UGU8_9HYPH|nr:adenosine deaminase [Pararhizobium mangrovi]TPW32664.1 adenosine deaminase [Pararhizobium mangrovi]